MQLDYLRDQMAECVRAIGASEKPIEVVEAGGCLSTVTSDAYLTLASDHESDRILLRDFSRSMMDSAKILKDAIKKFDFANSNPQYAALLNPVVDQINERALALRTFSPEVELTGSGSL